MSCGAYHREEPEFMGSKIQPGMVSERTTLNSGLLEPLWGQFKLLYEEHVQLSTQANYAEVFEAWQDMDVATWKQAVDYGDLREEASALVDELSGDLDTMASMEGLRFGAHEGDGALIGYWKEEDRG